MSEDLVYPRDAGWYDHPNLTSAKVLHWPGKTGRHSLTFSACGRSALADDEQTGLAIRAEDVSVGVRCRGAGCRKRWADFDARESAPVAAPAGGEER